MRSKRPVAIGNIVAELMSRKGFGRQRSAQQRETIWQEVVGADLAQMTRCGEVRRRRLEVVVANSTLMQELAFRKEEIIEALQHQLPELVVEDIRFRVGPISR
ncbi:MAG: DUF721 domain-containing protein [Planctomycetales bacterium]